MPTTPLSLKRDLKRPLSHKELDDNFFILGDDLDNHNHALDSLSNVDTTSKITGQALVWSGTSWIPQTIIGGTSDTNVKHWLKNTTKVLNTTDTVVISGNYVLDQSTLELTNTGNEFTVGDIVFNEYSQIFIGENLVLRDSNIINNGLISVSGGILLVGNSSITGTGIII